MPALQTPLAVSARSIGAAGEGQSPGATSTRHPWRGTAAALATATLVYLVIASGTLPAGVVLVGALCLLVSLPTSPDLARRVALNGSALVGWVCTTWWVRWPVPVNHGGLVVAAAAAGLVALVTSSGRPRERLRLLLPRTAASDLLLPVGGLLSLLAMWRWAFPASADAALTALLPGVDNVAHFHMFSTMRAYGAVTPALGSSPDGSPWTYDQYPQGFHAVAATLSELVRPHVAPGPHMAVAYTQAVAMVVVLGVVVLSAAIVSVAGLRSRPLVALPVVVCTWAAYLWEPGQNALADGFANFWLAAASVGVALLLPLGASRRLAVPDVVAVAGLLVLVAHAWAPLVVIAGAAVLALVHPLRSTWRDRHLRARIWLFLAVFVVAGLGVAKALAGLFANVAVSTLVKASGGVHGTAPGPAFILLVAGCYACLAAPALVRRRGVPAMVPTADRARLLLVGPAAGVLLGAALLVSQLRATGMSSYYFVKYFVGFELILAALVPALCGFLVVSLTVQRRGSGARVCASILASALATQFFGAFPPRTMPLTDRARTGTASLKGAYSAGRLAAGVLAATRHSTPRDGFERDYVALGRDGAGQAFYADAWYHGLLATLSVRTSERFDVLHARVDDADDAVPLVRTMLTGDPRLTVLVARQYAPAVRAGLAEPGLSRRVVSVEPEGER